MSHALLIESKDVKISGQFREFFLWRNYPNKNQVRKNNVVFHNIY